MGSRNQRTWKLLDRHSSFTVQPDLQTAQITQPDYSSRFQRTLRLIKNTRNGGPHICLRTGRPTGDSLAQLFKIQLSRSLCLRVILCRLILFGRILARHYWISYCHCHNKIILRFHTFRTRSLFVNDIKITHFSPSGFPNEVSWYSMNNNDVILLLNH